MKAKAKSVEMIDGVPVYGADRMAEIEQQFGGFIFTIVPEGTEIVDEASGTRATVSDEYPVGRGNVVFVTLSTWREMMEGHGETLQ